MTSSRNGALLLALVVLLLAPTTVAVARVGHPVPIKGSVLTEDLMMQPDDCPATSEWRYLALGTGHFSHLGAVGFEITHCSRWLSDSDGEMVNGVITLTAANGDVLTLAHQGTFTVEFGPDPEEPEWGYSYPELEWVVLDGTGRFAGATGSGTATAIGDLFTDTTTATFVGTIDYDASNRAARLTGDGVTC